MGNLIGQPLGRYHILEQLGSGGMAIVYKAYDTRLERDVAVKVIRRGAFPPDQIGQILKRFALEAKALAHLSHPNILKVLDYGEYESSPYLVLEYMPGGTLKQKLKSKPIHWQEALRILVPIASALEYAHQQGIIHRDVKPSNILLTDKGQSMLSDFGIAKILESGTMETLTGTGVGVGTPEYMAPEQWTGEAAAQSDIYSLGVVLYEMITGRKPYMADTPAAILLKQANEPLPRPSQFVSGLPENVEKVLIKALAKRLPDRFPSMTDFVRALDDLEQGRRVDLTTTTSAFSTYDTYATVEQNDSFITHVQDNTRDDMSMVRPVQSTSQRKSHWWMYAAAGALTLFLCAGVVGIVWLFRPTPGTPPQSAVIYPTEALLQSTAEVQPVPTQVEAPPLPTAALQIAPTQEPLPIDTPYSPPTDISTSNPAGKIVYTCQISRNSEQNDICIMNADGSGYKQLTNNGANNGWASISPDGRTVLFSSNVSGAWRIYSVSSGGGTPNQLTSGPDEAISPDISMDGKIVYKNSSKATQMDSIWVMNADGSGAHEVHMPGWDPVWSPDGLRILFASGNLSAPQLYIIGADGSGLTKLTNTPDIRGRSDWSVQNLIVFYAGGSWKRNLYLIEADGSNLTQITNGGNSQAPSFSPDGQWIAFTGYFDNMGNADGCEIYLVRIDGSDLRRLTSNSYCDWQPRWGP